MTKQFLLFFSCLLLANAVFAQNTASEFKKFNEVGFYWKPTQKENASVYGQPAYSLLYKRELTKLLYLSLRPDGTHFSRSDLQDTTLNNRSAFWGGTIGLEFRHNRKNKTLTEGDMGSNFINSDKFFFFHGPEFTYETGYYKNTPNAVKNNRTTIGGGYGLGLMAYFGEGRKQFSACLQYIPGVYQVKHFINGHLHSTTTEKRLDHRALFMTISYRWAKQ
jgi:hypothetical protein